MTFSFSRAESYRHCPYEFYLGYICLDDEGDHIYPPESNFYAEYGKFMHEILEKILKRELTQDEAISYYIENFDIFVLSHTRESIRDKTKERGLIYLASEDFDEFFERYYIEGVEQKITFSIGDISVIGYIDVLVRDKESGDLIIIDHKSADYPMGKKGKILKKCADQHKGYQMQMALYVIGVEQMMGERVGKVCWNHFKEEDPERRFLIEDVDDTLIEEAKEWLTETVERTMTDDMFAPNKDWFYCHNLCNYRSSCEYMLMEEDNDE